jgi:tRNA(Arg) A34 adenosine deaminase TadA
MNKISEDDIMHINKAIHEANNSDGGPFGAIIVKDNKIISYGNNKVSVLNDPTAHAEIVAIREACKQSNNFSLEGCTLYTSCEPCPMCLSAIYWARIKDVYYANTREDAASIDFDDNEIYEEVKKDIKDRKIKMTHIDNTNAYDTFVKWKNNSEKIHY